MEATRLVFILAVFAMAAAGCSKPSASGVKASTSQGPECAGQVIPQHFLVEWQTVPKEFESKRIAPHSNITRFTKIEKEALEQTVLKKYEGQYSLAEHEFYIQQSMPAFLEAQSTCSTPTAWGPNDIQASSAWTASGKQGEGVIVAVVDSGVDIDHPLLASQIWTNPNEVAGNGKDDDGDGYVDDVHGYNFANDTGDVTDTNGHGTHVSGIIAGQTGSLGFTGAAPKAKIMALKFIGDDGSGDAGTAIAAIQYAYAHGAKVINASWGGDCSELLNNEVRNSVLHGIVFVNAAGNGDAYGNGYDLSTHYPTEWPAALQIPGKITVGAMSSSQVLTTFSNYGQLVDLAAPGQSILSTLPSNQLCALSGTSMATPFVAGVAALLLSTKPSLSPIDVTNILNATVTKGAYGVRTAGKLNALKAVTAALE